MSEVFTLVGYLRGKNETGCFIERYKQGQSAGAAQEYSKARNNITDAAIGQLSGLNVGDEIRYKTQNYCIQSIEKKVAGSGGGGFRGGSPKSPEERRSIELQSTYRVTADIFIACLQKSNAPVAMDFSKMVETVWTETVKVADKIRQQSKEGGV